MIPINLPKSERKLFHQSDFPLLISLNHFLFKTDQESELHYGIKAPRALQCSSKITNLHRYKSWLVWRLLDSAFVDLLPCQWSLDMVIKIEIKKSPKMNCTTYLRGEPKWLCTSSQQFETSCMITFVPFGNKIADLKYRRLHSHSSFFKKVANSKSLQSNYRV